MTMSMMHRAIKFLRRSKFI